MTYEKDEETGTYIFDIFNKDGAFFSRNTFDTSIHDGTILTKIKGNRIYCVCEKDSGYRELVVYKINWAEQQ